MIENGQYQRSTGRLPKWFKDRPPLRRTDWFYLIAFSRLATCRQFSQGFGPIPWTAVIQYARTEQLDATMTDYFVSVILALDSAYRRYVHETREAEDRDQRRLDRAAERKDKNKGW